VERLEALLDEEIAHVREEGVTSRELTKAVNARRAGLIQQRLTVQSKAEALQWYALHEGSARRLNDEMARYEAVTVDDLRRVAETYLIPSNQTVVVARPADVAGAVP
jgi:predicted Zn-dependent peptidase